MRRSPAPGILSGPVEDGAWRRRAPIPEVEAVPGLRVVHLGSRFAGVVVRVDHEGGVVVRVRSTNTGLERVFQLHPGAFQVDGRAVSLVRPRPTPSAAPARTASGSTVVAGARARVARAGRILVEGVHDAELVEKVWGDDLRIEGVVVERLDGVDDLAIVVDAFGPGADARLGVLVDHLVEGSKEWRLARQVVGPHVMVTGHPYVDVWQAIRPGVVGLHSWPDIPRGRPWKEGIGEALGEPVPGRLWKRLLGTVTTYADLEAPLVGAVESLIDFVTAPPA